MDFFLSLFECQGYECFVLWFFFSWFFKASFFSEQTKEKLLQHYGYYPSLPWSSPLHVPHHVLLMIFQRAKLQVFWTVSLTTEREDNSERSPVLAFTPFFCIMALLLVFEISWFQMYFLKSCTSVCMCPLYIIYLSVFWLISLFPLYLEPKHGNFVTIFTLCLWNPECCSAIHIQGL